MFEMCPQNETVTDVSSQGIYTNREITQDNDKDIANKHVKYM